MCYLSLGKGEGTDFGPKLIRNRLLNYRRTESLEAIMNPSAGVSFGYETTELQMKDGTKRTGLIASKTETEIDLKSPGGTVDKIAVINCKDDETKRRIDDACITRGNVETTISGFIGILIIITEKIN